MKEEQKAIMFDVSVPIRNFSMKFVTVVFLAVFSLLTTACRQQQDNGSATGIKDLSDVTLTISLNTAEPDTPFLKNALGTASDIVRVTVDVIEGETSLVTEQELTRSGNDYSGTITALPVGPLLTFVTHAYDVSSTEIFSGTTLQALTGVSDSVNAHLTPNDDGSGTILPAVQQIEYLDTLTPLNSEMIRFTVSGTLNEDLDFQIAAGSGSGSFKPASGTIPIRSATATMISLYTASDTTGDYEHTLTVTNSQGNSVSVHFTTVISTNYVNSDIEVAFYPVIRNLGGKRVDNEVRWTAIASDDRPLEELTYLWTFDGGLAFENNTANPATLLNYSTPTTGILGLTVTDDYGSGLSTQISYNLMSGMFPDPGDIEDVGILDYILPDTGQIQSYTATYGEDADYIGYSPAYLDNGDGTVTDIITTLIWQKDVVETERNWADSNTYCQNLSLGNFSDWRLPSLLEFKDIVDYGVYNPTIDTAFFNMDNDTFRYWSADTSAGTARKIDFTRGTSNEETDTTSHYSRCVRGTAIDNGSLTDNGNSTASDSTTQLTWQINEGGIGSWENALAYCETLSLGGASDWRLPNIKELFTIVDLSAIPTTDMTVFTDAISGLYWSSTTRTDSAGYALVQNFSNGNITTGYKTGSGNIRCVRGGL